MQTIEIIYSEMNDLHKNIEYLKQELCEVDQKSIEWEKEFVNSTFNSSEGYFLYTAYRDFLQERRLLKSEIESLEIQFEILGGKAKLDSLKKSLTLDGYKKSKPILPSNQKTDPKFFRKKGYFTNFRSDIKEKIFDLYHIDN